MIVNRVRRVLCVAAVFFALAAWGILVWRVERWMNWHLIYGPAVEQRLATPAAPRLTVTWSEVPMLYKGQNCKVQFGFRSDGVVVWRQTP